MQNFVVTDALTGDVIEFDLSTGDATLDRRADSIPQCDSIFFPGCSFINYAMPLVSAVYKTLFESKVVEGISVLCCGKILSYEPDGENVRSAFEGDFCDHVYSAGIKKIVCACPNCVKALREAFLKDERMKDVEILVLPKVLADLGYRLDKETCALLIKGNAEEDVLLCPHDSCPDREYGEFADGLRALIPNDLWVDPEHNRKRSICCGSLPRAAGKIAQADKCAEMNGKEALDVKADAIVTSCMSCTFQLNMAQPYIQCVNYLELLYSWRIDWSTVGAWMKLRFLFNETLGVIEKNDSGRVFSGLGEGI